MAVFPRPPCASLSWSSVYPIINVPPDAPEDVESLGSRQKFWFDRRQLLFKEVREHSGEDWAEKVCAEVARMLALPHAEYELALWNRGGMASAEWSVAISAMTRRRLFSGTSFWLRPILTMSWAFPSFMSRRTPSIACYRPCRRGLHGSRWVGMPQQQLRNAAELFAGFLLLDALVGNTDRHHENWGVVRTMAGDVHLAPTFDHASSLGAHALDDQKREPPPDA